MRWIERSGGSSGGSGASLAANFATVAVGQESFASIRRPVGMRPTAGLVSRSGVYDGWPQISGSLGPMARTVADVAALLDVLVGYDPEDPLTARGVDHVPDSYKKFLDKNGLKGARIGVLRESMGSGSEPDTEDFAKIVEVFNKAITELKGAGALLIDPIVIPRLKELLARRAVSTTEVDDSFKVFFGSSTKAPFKSCEEMMRSPDFAKLVPYA
jgi:Asp-tRNA(Asn)/Glu-tRNA(Gln) amidotransferase A subunit family amidase